MTRPGVFQTARLTLFGSLLLGVPIAIGRPAVSAELVSGPISNRAGSSVLVLAQAAQPQSVPDASGAAEEQSAQEIEFTSPTFDLGVQGSGGSQEPLDAGVQQNSEPSGEAAEPVAADHEFVDFTVEDSNEAIARFGCDDLYCINAIREQRGLPPLQLVWDAEQNNGGSR